MGFKDKPNIWAQEASALSEIQPRSYIIQIEKCAVLRWSQQVLMGPAAADQRTGAAEQRQQTLENPSPEAPVLVQEQTLKSSSIHVEPPETLTEQI